MDRLVSLIFLISLFGAAAGAAAEPDRLIVPGERVGAVTPDATEDSLREVYGADRVTPQLIEVGEGFVCAGSRITTGADEGLEVAWLDPEARAGIAEVRVMGSVWRTKEGLSLGLTLQQLERLNRKPFRLAGFGWDYGGTITSWDGGRLARLDVEAPSARLILRFSPDMAQVARRDLARVLGDRDFSSGHPDMQKLNPQVTELIVRFDRSRQCKTFFKG